MRIPSLAILAVISISQPNYQEVNSICRMIGF